MNTISIWDKLINGLIIAILLVFPFVVNIALISSEDTGHPVVALNLSLADLLIVLALLIWMIKIVSSKKIKYVKLPPMPILILLIVSVISIVNVYSIKEWMKELIQLIEYLFLFYVLLINNPYVLKFKIIINVLLGFSLIILIIAFYQYFINDGTPYLIRGLFENRNIMGTYLCMIIPLIYGQIIYTSRSLITLCLVLILVLALLVLLSGSALLSIFISLLIMSIVVGRKIFYRFLIVVLLIGILFPIVMPDKNIRAVSEFATIYEKGDISENYYRRLAILAHAKKKILYNKQVDKNSIVISTSLFMSSILPEVPIGNRYREMTGRKHVKNQCLEIQAALNMTAENILLGCGLGNYQNNIGKHYGSLPKVNTSEPNQHNGYLILSSTLGILGLAIFLMILRFFGKRAYTRFENSNESNNKGLYIGLLGCIIACAVNNLFCVILVSVLMVPLVTIFALLTITSDS